MGIKVFKMYLKASQVLFTSAVVLVGVSPLPSLNRAQGKDVSAGGSLWKVIPKQKWGLGCSEAGKMQRHMRMCAHQLKLFALQGQKVE